jgi:hypothetical protein
VEAFNGLIGSQGCDPGIATHVVILRAPRSIGSARGEVEASEIEVRRMASFNRLPRPRDEFGLK